MNMEALNWQIIHVSFKAVCIIAAATMVAFWIITFQKNEDVSSIEVISFGSRPDIRQPEITICVNNPFLEEKLQNISSNVTSQGYTQYLKGNMTGNELYNSISFEDVTINILEYFDHLDEEIYILFESGIHWIQVT